jgi:hypothetical protein
MYAEFYIMSDKMSDILSSVATDASAPFQNQQAFP